MDYRVAVFRRAENRLVFVKFAYSGYAIAPDGRLMRGGRECNTQDRRQRRFYEINHKLPKTDRLGRDLYERDIVFDSRFGTLSTVLWNPSGCAFVLATKNRGFTIKYRYCDFRDSVELVGNEYENILNQITAKGMTK